MKIVVGEEYLTPAEPQEDEVPDEVLAVYVESLRKQRTKRGEPIPGKREKFEAMAAEAVKYQKLNGGYLSVDSDDCEGFLTYRSNFISHYPGDGLGADFWGKTLSEHTEYAMGTANGQVEVFIHELFVKLQE